MCDTEAGNCVLKPENISILVSDNMLSITVGDEAFKKLIKDVNFRGVASGFDLSEDQVTQVCDELATFVRVAVRLINGRRK
jgi:hypothetical protein